MEKFEVRLMVSSHLGITTTWRKKIKAPRAILAGHMGVKRFWRHQIVHAFIVRGVVQRPGVPGHLGVYPFYEENLGGTTLPRRDPVTSWVIPGDIDFPLVPLVSADDLRAKWRSADELTPEQLEAWLDVSPEWPGPSDGATVGPPNWVVEVVEALRRGRQAPPED